MRRATILFAMLLPALLLMAVTAVQARRQSRPWQRALVAYASLNGPSASSPLSVQIVEQAEAPQQFSLELSGSVLGSNPYYRVNGSYTGQSPQSGPRPVPYPPVGLWCALLERVNAQDRGSGKRTTSSIIYVAEHRDLYNGAILIHEAAEKTNTAATLQALRRVGCDKVAAQIDLLNGP